MSKRHRYSWEQEVFLIQKVEGLPYEKLAELFNKEFNANVNSESVRQKCYALGVKNNINPRFKKGTLPSTTLPVGAESIDEDGNPIVKIGQPRHWKKKSHIIWEKHNGPVPYNHFVIFLNQNKKDCRIENLALVSRSTFYRLVHSGMYTENAQLTQVGITMTQLKQKINEHEKIEKEESEIARLRKKIKFLEKENTKLNKELNRIHFVAECIYQWGKNYRNGVYKN